MAGITWQLFCFICYVVMTNKEMQTYYISVGDGIITFIILVEN